MLNEADKLWVKDLSSKIAHEINEKVISQHIESCPHGKSLMASKFFLAGVCVGSGFAGGGLALAVARALL